jgi:hypothetical protein
MLYLPHTHRADRHSVRATQQRHFAVIVMLFHKTVGTSRSSSVNDNVVGLHVRCVRGAKTDAFTLFFQVAIKIAKKRTTRVCT